MQSKATTVEAYLRSLPQDRRAALEAVRKVIRANLDPGYEEGMQYGMIGYYVPLSRYPAGYHCTPNTPLPFAGLASQKNYMSVYLMCIYTDSSAGASGEPDELRWFREAWTRAKKKLDMGKGCVRFKRLEDLPLEVLGEAIRRSPVKVYLERYERARASMGKARTTGASRSSKSAKPRQRVPAAKRVKQAADKR